jgi:hypothetical protein
MVKTCEVEGCATRPSFNLPTETVAIRCKAHILPGMINIKSTKCQEPSCTKQPSYGLIDGKTLYCASHAKEGMINKVTKRCAAENCETIPSFNIETETTPLYCKKHATEGMIEIVNNKCAFTGCKKRPNFGLLNSAILYCKDHKTPEMTDRKHSTCLHSECTKRPNFNLPGVKPGIYCADHKTDEMVSVDSRKCKVENCNTRPCFNYESEPKGIYCSRHKLPNMINVVDIDKLCTTPLCSLRGSKKFKGLCLFCFIHTYPDEPISRHYRSKERTVAEHVKSTFPDLPWAFDKIVSDGCSNKRPDLLLDLGYQVIIVEVDENQHRSYDCSCENKRLMEISRDVDHRPIIFIRFNPDEYIITNTVIRSCWIVDRRGIVMVDPCMQTQWNDRLKSLTDQIKYWIDPAHVTDKTVEVIQLFFDQ